MPAFWFGYISNIVDYRGSSLLAPAFRTLIDTDPLLWFTVGDMTGGRVIFPLRGLVANWLRSAADGPPSKLKLYWLGCVIMSFAYVLRLRLPMTCLLRF